MDLRVVLLALVVAVPAAGAQPAKHHRKGTAPPKAAVPPPAAEGEPKDYDAEPPSTAPHMEGDYGGVAPDHPAKPDPAKKPKRPPSKGTLSWIGFEAKDGGANIFFQSVAAFELAQHVEGDTLVVDLGGLSRFGPNTWREIDTKFFETPIAKITAKYVGAARASKTGPAHGSGIEIRIAFKNAKDAHEGSVRSATEADRMYYQYLSFTGSGGSVPTATGNDK